MLKANVNKKFCAVCYNNSSTYNDLVWYAQHLHQVKVDQCSPEEFLSTPPSREFQYINLITRQDNRRKVTEYMDQQDIDRFSLITDHSVTNTSLIGNGCFIYPNVTIYPNAVIENDVLINGMTGIAHNVVIGQGSFISGGTIIAGSAIIGKHCWFAMQSIVLENAKIDDYFKTRLRSLCGPKKHIS